MEVQRPVAVPRGCLLSGTSRAEPSAGSNAAAARYPEQEPTASDGTGVALRRDASLPEHESVTVGRTKAKLAHAPRLVSWRLQNLGTDGDGPPVERVNVVDTEVSDIAVIAELAGGRHVGTSAEHECDSAGATEAPVARVDVIEFTLEDVAVPGSGHVQIMNRENWIRADDPHDAIVPRSRQCLLCGRRAYSTSSLPLPMQRRARAALPLQA